MSVFDELKIDCHTHVFDPLRFPYRSDTFYRPVGQEITTSSQLLHLMDAYGVGGALVVGPNSGYASDNRCLLDALARGGGRLKGIAVVEPDASAAELEGLKRNGVVGVAFNPTILGLDYYRRTRDLLARLADLELLLQIQVEKDQLLGLLDLIADSRVAVVVDHCVARTRMPASTSPASRLSSSSAEAAGRRSSCRATPSSRASPIPTAMRGLTCVR